MGACIFCRIINGEVPCQKVFESEWLVAFRDIQPKAPVHILIVPKQHIDSLNAWPADDKLSLAVLQAAPTIAQQCGIAESGYRMIANINRDGGQEVFHVHFHLLGGRPLGPMVDHG